jgi:hypothetical protein
MVRCDAPSLRAKLVIFREIQIDLPAEDSLKAII